MAGHWPAIEDHAVSGLCVRRLQRVALQPRRILLQRADAGGFGLAAPFLQVAQGFTGVVAAGLEQRRQAHAVFDQGADRSEEHTSELQSLMRISYAGFGLKKKKQESS